MSLAAARALLGGLASSLLLVLASGCADPKVIRVFDGVAVEGRFISYETYAYYGRGAEAEQRGDMRNAALFYEGAAERDPQSAEIWTRLGAVRCTSKSAAQSAMDAFAQAEEIDPSYATLHHEKARCALAQGQLDQALSSAERALGLDPLNDKVVLHYALLLERAGKAKQADQALHELLLQRPTALNVWFARYELAQRQKQQGISEHIARELKRRAPELAKRVEKEIPALGPLASVDDALRRGDLAQARKAALHAHLSSPELAVRAAALGMTNLALEQADLVVGADPSSSSARIALAVAADLAGDSTKLETAMKLAETQSLVPPSPLARALFAELLARRIGPDAARAFLGPSAPEKDGSADPLLEALERRLRERLKTT